MNRLTRTMVSVVATATLVGAGAPAIAATSHGHADKPTVKVEVSEKAKPKPPKGKNADKGKSKDKNKTKAGKGSKKVTGERNAALQILRSRDQQVAKAVKAIEKSYADADAQAALLANAAADRAGLVATKTELLAATTVVEVKEAKAELLALRVTNYDDALFLLEWVVDNAEYVDGEPGYEAALAKGDEAVALLVTVNASTDKGVLVAAEDLLDEADVLIEEVDESIYGEDDEADDSDDDEDIDEDSDL